MTRTTISLPTSVHEDLLLQAFREKKTLGEIVLKKMNMNKTAKKKDVDSEVKRIMAFFRKIAGEGVALEDAAKVVREERDRDNA